VPLKDIATTSTAEPRWITVTTGNVKWFNSRKGFGFLTAEDGTEVFVHTSAVPADVASLRPGDSVEFTTEQGVQGEQVADLRLVERAPAAHGMPSNGSAAPRTDLAVVIETAIKQLDELRRSIQERGAPSRVASFNAARSLRSLANRLNPPPA